MKQQAGPPNDEEEMDDEEDEDDAGDGDDAEMDVQCGQGEPWKIPPRPDAPIAAEVRALVKKVFARLLDSAGGFCGNSESTTSLSETPKSTAVEDFSTPARRRSARVAEDVLPADLSGVTYSGLFLGSCAFHGKDVVATAAAKSAASGRWKSKATKKREREDAEDEERVKKAKAQEDRQQRDDKKMRLGEEKVRLAEEKARLAEEKARKIEKALAGVASAADAKHAVENTEKKIEQAVLLREHEMKVEVAEAERKRGIADGDIELEEGEDGKSEKILELLTSWSAI
ncbi:hypothetical protein CYMTET_45586 [Cymbomonas tetramitiformis]|uniref:Uncharacterized protein n=1 Tax=Cymbomonas tetramitiformis TaxID=36881 RepID=A0AAE0BZB4_9CHLO|nr:hypothetical protein CYMTET_45586 [Cymbomonas tetramitiformis]